ncbi:MAG: hypothetical protein K2X66_00970, partial [Cyanobacteria bacterium]|nr:hypothetical protein [Cyanobacteriota bacterium]
INQTALKKELVKFTEHTADSIYKDLETEIAWQQEQMKTLGHFLKAQYGFTHQFPQVAQEVLALSTDTDSVAWYDSEGKNLGSVYRNYAHLSPELRLPIKLETTPKLSNPKIANSKIEFQVLYSNTGNAEDNTYYLRALIPLASLGSQSNASGYYMIQKKFNFLAQLIHANTKTLHSSVYIIDNTGMILAGPLGNQSERQFINPKDFAFFQSIPDGVTQEYSTTAPTTLFTHPTQGKLSDEDTEDLPPLQKVFVKMPTIGWGILLESPYNVRQTYVKRARDQSLLLIIACMGLVILLALFYILGINRNFRQLIKALKAMAEGNYSRRIRLITNTTTPMEIVFLTGEFNRMARKMADAWNKSQELNQELIRKHEEESFLSRTTKMLHGTLSLDEISTITTHQVAQFFEAAVCVLALKPSSS